LIQKTIFVTFESKHLMHFRLHLMHFRLRNKVYKTHIGLVM